MRLKRRLKINIGLKNITVTENMSIDSEINVLKNFVLNDKQKLMVKKDELKLTICIFSETKSLVT